MNDPMVWMDDNIPLWERILAGAIFIAVILLIVYYATRGLV